jgi:multimeric flavodoxin WrbA
LNILALVGSPRLGGNTDFLVDQALAEAAGLGAETEKIVLSQYDVKPCLGHDECSDLDQCVQRDDTAWILDKFCKADGVILATPVYYYNVSAQLKAFMDRNYFLYNHNRKSQARVVGIIVVAEADGIEDTVHTLRRFINESFDVAKDRIFEVHGYASRRGDIRNNAPLLRQARELGRQMVESLKVDG